MICPWCGRWIHQWVQHICAPVPDIQSTRIGCICPPGANKECERRDCPRKAVNISTMGML